MNNSFDEVMKDQDNKSQEGQALDDFDSLINLYCLERAFLP